MKLYSPILLLFLILVSCREIIGNDAVQQQDSIAFHLEQLTRDTTYLKAIHHEKRASALAETSQNDSIKYRVLLYKLDYVIIPHQPDSIPFYLHQIETKAKQFKSKLNTAYAMNRTAEYHYSRQDFHKAFAYYHASQEIFEGENDHLNAAYNLLMMAGIQQFYNDYGGSEQVLTDAVVHLDNVTSPDKTYLRDVYIKLGIAYMGMNEATLAITYYEKAKSYTDAVSEKLMIDNNIALAYQKDDDNDQAIKLFSGLLQHTALQSDIASIAIISDNLGHARFKKDGISGLSLMEKALKSRLARNDAKGLAYSYLHLAEFHAKNNPSMAAGYAQKAYDSTSRSGAVDQQLKAIELLIQHGGIELARTHQKRYFELNDSINSIRLSAKNHFAKMRYDASKVKKSNLQYNLDEQKHNNTIISIISISVFILVTVFFLYILSHFLHKRKIQQQAYQTEIRIAKKLHDEIANDVFNTMAFAEVKDLATPENKELLINSLDNIYEQARNIAKENTSIPIDEGFSLALKEMLSGYANNTVSIMINGLETIEWLPLQKNKKIVVYRVLQELLVNMKKHSQCSVVVISFEKKGNKIQVNYADNGVGMGSGKVFTKNGLQNVENRIESINGSVTFEALDRKGFKASFSFNQ